jgi:hypothetical protein
MADGLPLSKAAESRHTIIEARIANGWERIASCTEPCFRDGYIELERVVLNQFPEFTLHPVPVEVWLSKKMLAVTNVVNTEYRHSTTSWVCEFDFCESISELSPESGVYILLNAKFRF